MKNSKTLLLLVSILIATLEITAQTKNFYGLWGVSEVKVGEEIMTPVAKWFRVNKDGTFQAGNGWLQNNSGEWKYDSIKKLLSTNDSLDLKDNYGAFSVEIDGENMRWSRTEDGMEVNVYLNKIDKLPMSTTDLLKGVWKLKEITLKEESIKATFDPNGEHQLFIRWDRVYVDYDTKGNRRYGYWHIHGHRPELTLLPRYKDGKVEKWTVKVDASELILTGISESNQNIVRSYYRENTL